MRAGINRASDSAGNSSEVTPASESSIRSLAGGGQPLSLANRSFFEPRFGTIFSGVRVHTGDSAGKLAEIIQAKAFTVGGDIVFGRGHYTPGTSEGKRLLAHELTHVVHQTVAGQTKPVRIVQRTECAMVQGFWMTEEPAGGCGICYGVINPKKPAAAAGTAAHAVIERAYRMRLAHLGKLVEFPFSSPTDDNGRLDLALATPTGLKIGEIKPSNPAGERQGIKDLDWYKTQLQMTYPNSRIEMLDERLPLGVGLPMPDPIASFSGCPPQVLAALPMRLGLYGYFCVPPFSAARRLCSCRPPFIPVPIPEKVPVPEEAPARVRGRGGERTAPETEKKGPSRLPWAIPPLVIAILGALAAFLVRTPWGRLGLLLGALLRWLGLRLGIAGVTAAATMAGTAGAAPLPRPGRLPSGPTPPPSRTVVVPEPKGKPGAGISVSKVPAKTKAIEVGVIEGLDPERVSVGMMPAVWLFEKGKPPKEKLFAVLQVTKKISAGGYTTVEFKSLLENRAGINTLGGNFYTVTKPYRGPKEPAWVGHLTFTGEGHPQYMADYLEILALELEDAGRKVEANQVREEIQRLKRLAKEPKP